MDALKQHELWATSGGYKGLRLVWASLSKEQKEAIAHADLCGVNLSGADLSGADLSHYNLSGADLSYIDLNDTNLSGANLSGANLSGANLSGANLIVLHLPIWTVYICAGYIRIGCKYYSYEDWEQFSDREINYMDYKALDWWHRYKKLIFAAVDSLKSHK